MRRLVLIATGFVWGCAPTALIEDADTPAHVDSRPAEAARVELWTIATTGDQPPSCDERLAAEGLGPDELPLGIPFEIVHLNEMKAIRLLALSYTVDGQCSFSWSHDSTFRNSDPNQLNVIRVQLSPGEHEVMLVAEYGSRVPTPYGYDYRIKVRGSYVVDLDSATRLFVTGYEKGQATTSVEKRVALRFELADYVQPPVLLRR